jgi:cytoskeletal protein CcmA (bactofilin family)
MLMKPKSKKDGAVAVGSGSAIEADGSARAAGKAARPAMPSIIAAGVVLRGSLVSDGEVQLDGEVEGDVRAESLVVGQGASIVGEVLAGTVRIAGSVKGVVRAKRVELAATAVITGDVLHAALAVEAGARLDGKVCCLQDPLRGKAGKGGEPLPVDKVRAEIEALAEKRDGGQAGEAAPDREKRAA